MTPVTNVNKVVLAYSGGLDTSIIIPWLKENFGCEVIAMVADVGQAEDLEAVRQKAFKSGASKVYVEDLKVEFLTEYVFPTLMAGAVYESKYLLGTSFARPIIAKRQIEIARLEGAEAVAHGCTGKGNDQVRFELTYKALDPGIKIIAPWRLWSIRSREEAMDYASRHGIPVPVTKAKPYSMDRNIWHISYEGGILEDPNGEPPEDMFLWSVSPEKAPDESTYVEIGFEKGRPVSVNGDRLGPIELMTLLNKIGAQNGVGRVDIVENRLVGMKSRGVYETPGGTLLYAAHKELEYLALDRETMHFKELVASRFAEMVYYGQWFTPLRAALSAFVESTQRMVNGSVKLKLYKGSVTIAGRSSANSLYIEDLATFGADSVYDQKDAAGFINLFGLPLTVQALVSKKTRAGAVGEAGKGETGSEPSEEGVSVAEGEVAAS